MKILSRQQMRAWDLFSIQKEKIAACDLMDKAGRAVLDALLPFKKGASVLIVCGSGNNGGDGLVLSRLLARKKISHQVFLAGQSGHFSKLKNKKFTHVIDALFGTGLNRKLSPYFIGLVEWMNSIPAFRVAIDIPSGLDCDTGKSLGAVFKADLTVTMGAPKMGFFLEEGPEAVGDLCVADIGLSKKYLNTIKTHFFYSGPKNMELWCAKRKRQSHKGTFGAVAVVACSNEKTGAGLLSTEAALKVGAGLSTLVLPQSAFTHIDFDQLELMYAPVGDANYFRNKDAGPVLEKIKSSRVVALGPGLGVENETIRFVHSLLEKIKAPLVLDADGLNAVSKKVSLLKKRKFFTVLTPHPKEMSRLTGLSVKTILQKRFEVAREFAKKYKVVLVLKGYQTLVASPDGCVWINSSGGPAMAVAGQGDCLTGLIAGFISQFGATVESVVGAVFLHGAVGDFLVNQLGYRLVTPTDIINNLNAFYRYLKK